MAERVVPTEPVPVTIGGAARGNGHRRPEDERQLVEQRRDEAWWSTCSP